MIAKPMLVSVSGDMGGCAEWTGGISNALGGECDGQSGVPRDSARAGERKAG
jgi:hypothetical protein